MENIYVFTGMSGSGKTAIIQNLTETTGYTICKIYTTRPTRKNENKLCISKSEYQLLPDKHIEFFYNKHNYTITKNGFLNSDIIEMSPSGIKQIRRSELSKRLYVFYIHTNSNKRYQRMLKRGDSIGEIKSRIEFEKEEYKNIEDIIDYSVENNILNVCTGKILSIINKLENT